MDGSYISFSNLANAGKAIWPAIKWEHIIYYSLNSHLT